MSRQRKGGAGAGVATQSLDALKVAKESIASTFDSLCEQDNNDGRFNSTIEAGLSATKRVMSAEIYQNLMKSVLERELQTWKLTRENAAFDRAEEAKERSSSSSSSSAAGSKRGRDDDDVDSKIGFTKDDTDKLVKRIREIAQAQLRKEEASVAKLKFYKDQAKKVDRGGNADADADIQEVCHCPVSLSLLPPPFILPRPHPFFYGADLLTPHLPPLHPAGQVGAQGS